MEDQILFMALYRSSFKNIIKMELLKSTNRYNAYKTCLNYNNYQAKWVN